MNRLTSLIFALAALGVGFVLGLHVNLYAAVPNYSVVLFFAIVLVVFGYTLGTHSR